MNSRSIEQIKEAYKPYKYTIKGNAHILNSTSGDIVIKEKKKDPKELYDYLYSRNFSNMPPIVDDNREGVVIYSYVPDTSMPKEQKASDLIKVLANLHQKTTYYKEVSTDEYKKIYEKIKEQIDYLRYYYDTTFDEFFKEVYPSPSHYFLLTNISKILAAFDFAEHELESWYEKVVDLKKYRVCQIHNKVSLEHFHKSDKEYLISWEDSRRDSPVLDLIKFYQDEYFDLPFQTLLATYQKINPLSDEEKQLFFIVISIPFKVDFKGSEVKVYQNIREVLDYVYKTEELIRPYYAVEKE